MELGRSWRCSTSPAVHDCDMAAFPKPAESSLPSVEVVPLVAVTGKQVTPSFSPDGNQVASGIPRAEHWRNLHNTRRRGEVPATDKRSGRLLSDVVTGWSTDRFYSLLRQRTYHLHHSSSRRYRAQVIHRARQSLAVWLGLVP